MKCDESDLLQCFFNGNGQTISVGTIDGSHGFLLECFVFGKKKPGDADFLRNNY